MMRLVGALFLVLGLALAVGACAPGMQTGTASKSSTASNAAPAASVGAIQVIEPWARPAVGGGNLLNADLRIITGHWAALGYFRARGIYALDSGCIWGQHLTAFRLDAHEVPCCVDCWEMRKVKNREDQGI